MAVGAAQSPTLHSALSPFSYKVRRRIVTIARNGTLYGKQAP